MTAYDRHENKALEVKHGAATQILCIVTLLLDNWSILPILTHKYKLNVLIVLTFSINCRDEFEETVPRYTST